MFTNAQRPSTIENMTVEEYSKRKEIEPGKYIIRVVVHKTALNGPVNLIYHNDMEECLFRYYTLLRPLVTPQTKKLSELFFLTPTGRRFNKITETIKKVANRITHVILPTSTTYRKVITTEALKDDELSEKQVRAVEDNMAHSIQTSRRFYYLPGTSKATDAHCTIEMISKKHYFSNDKDNILMKEWPLTSKSTPPLEACRVIIMKYKLLKKDKQVQDRWITLSKKYVAMH